MFLWKISTFLLLSLVSSSLENNEGLMNDILTEVEAEVASSFLTQRAKFETIPGHARRGMTKKTLEMERRNEVVRQAAKKLAQKLNIELFDAASQLRDHMVKNRRFLSDLCTASATPCNDAEKFSKFRTFSGQCNNVQSNLWGAANIPLRRILSPCKREFFNTRSSLLGIGSRKSGKDGNNNGMGGGTNSTGIGKGHLGGLVHNEVQGRQSCPSVQFQATGSCPLGSILPNPRLVSSTFHTDKDVPSNRLTQMFTIFAQFVDHDITLAATYTITDCCANPTDTERCAPIQVSRDPFFRNGKCLDFKRSLIFCEELGCSTDPMNVLTAYIDGSNIYGSDSFNALLLRTSEGGELASSGSSLLPIIDGSFTAGDTRAAENPALASMHTLFMREHNRIAKLIQNKFPAWADEKIFQHTRRIVIAEYSNIVFGEFLPLILGNDNVFPSGSLSTTYDPKVDASIFNEFSVAAFRFGHTLLNARFDRRNPTTGSLLDLYLLRFNFENATLYMENPDFGMTSIVRGMSAQAAQKFDQFLTKEVTNFLFAKESDNFGFAEDLVTRNIQRGRDHSIQPWLSYRAWCGLPAQDNWNVVPSDISQQKWNILRRLYARVSDIDLFTGGLAEETVPGGTVGATFACIIKFQEIAL